MRRRCFSASPTSVIGMMLEMVKSDKKERFKRRFNKHDWNGA